MVEFDRLLIEEFVDVRIAAIGIGAALDDESSEAGGGVAEGAAAALDDVLEFLLAPFFQKGRALDGSQPGADADLTEVVEHGLADIRIGGVAVVFASVEAVGMPRLCKQLPGLGRLVDRGGRLPKEFEAVRNQAAGQLRVAEGQRLVDALAVDRQARGLPHPRVVPGRFRVPLIDK